MIYLFNQNKENCILFGESAVLYIRELKPEICYDDKNVFYVMANYETKEDCQKVMEYFKKRLELGCRTFTFPSQEKVKHL